MGGYRAVRIHLLALTTLSALLTFSGSPHAQGAKFANDLILKVERDGENFELLQDFTFVDAQERNWTAPAGTKVNGASIPSWLWSVIGSPMRGKYREASVIHDHYCTDQSRPWRQVHEVFYQAMLANGVSETQAQIMYAAVYRFGPRWDVAWKGYCAPKSFCHNSNSAAYIRIWNFRPTEEQERLEQIIRHVETGGDFDSLLNQLDHEVSEEVENIAFYIYQTDVAKRTGQDLQALKENFPSDFSRYDIEHNYAQDPRIQGLEQRY